MCGIAGFYNISPNILNLKNLKDMANSIAHRGPDGEGFFYRQGVVGLAHRRLSILELTELGSQPMTYFDSGLWVVFNGEIFNFVELRQELIKLGYVFKSNSDTEVLLASYIEWKEKAFLKFNGMWALAIYDQKENSIILSRDRFGIKPLYYFFENQQLVFGSELKVFHSIRNEFNFKWNKRSFRQAMDDSFSLEGTGQSLVDKVRNLMPGHYLKLNTDHGVINHVRWWNTLENRVPVPKNDDEKVELFNELLVSSCKLRMRSDVPVATSLSGGVDSSVIAGCLNELGVKANAFSYIFPGEKNDEGKYARLMANNANLKLIEVPFKLRSLSEYIDPILYSFEGIYPGLPDASYTIYEAQRKNGIKVSLDGHGVDEMLAGYSFFLDYALRDISFFSKEYWEILKMKESLAGNFYSSKIKIKALLNSFRLIEEIKPKRKKTYYTNLFYSEAVYEECDFSEIEHMSQFEKKLYRSFHIDTLPRILRNFDLMSMSNGIEVRMPFMDYRLVSYVFSLQEDMKIRDNQTKYILKEVAKKYVPSEILDRKDKVGFNTPAVSILKNSKDWIDDTLSNKDFVDDWIFKEKLNINGDNWDNALNCWSILSAKRLLKLYNFGE